MGGGPFDPENPGGHVDEPTDPMLTAVQEQNQLTEALGVTTGRLCALAECIVLLLVIIAFFQAYRRYV